MATVKPAVASAASDSAMRSVRADYRRCFSQRASHDRPTRTVGSLHGSKCDRSAARSFSWDTPC